MAYYAKVQDGVVVNVHVVANAVILVDGQEQESVGQAFLAELWGGSPADYVQCSATASIRACYPAIGYLWDGANFIAPVVSDPIVPLVSMLGESV